MHIPDGFLDAKTWITTTVVGAGAVTYSLRQAKLALEPKRVPLIALVGAFVFAAQMINFPIAGATSGHFLGGTMVSILFGPWIGSIVMTAVLLVQAIVYQDGGITALGANVLCTGFIGCFVGYGSYMSAMRLFKGKGRAIIAWMSAWLSIVAASAGVAILLAFSGTFNLATALTAMVGWHMLIGIGEGFITMLVTGYLMERSAVMTRGGLGHERVSRNRA
ncbi:cobalt/nickel transport system permease protein [Paenibacillus cellulosilyticus]|uniref:Cobalt/nickel transport system permease protein n=1 Tax=Paenibacillus cellulosilyticus TaxID=375489 RepID=A0A2V2YQQ1_9BACL|nr:energy-coupling factor ABC transporter permease [Paenibacillus cellulosilyticus]PWV95985.1 cobalt/nickel transport system permease protein [Paenibacillus cellulosilyticus]QKS48448.1 energy-coupling factor ABC transporter permease [Paenibacillus cellulosilyticus]